eukprot:7552408-Pyramimonas_sp.AAC.1
MEVWTNIGDQNERHINATYLKALRAVAGMTHATASEARFTDMQVMCQVRRPHMSAIQRQRRLRYFERI